jgi:hypothetical protein
MTALVDIELDFKPTTPPPPSSKWDNDDMLEPGYQVVLLAAIQHGMAEPSTVKVVVDEGN